MRSLFLLAALGFFSLPVFAKKIPGTIVTNGKPKEVIFEIRVPFLGNEPNFERIQYKVRYYDESGKKQTLRPDDADEIRFKYDGIDIRMISCANTLGGGSVFSAASRIFLKLEIDGQLRLYRYYFKQNTGGSFYGSGTYNPGTTITVDNLIFQKDEGPLKRPKSLGWKKDMLEYFSDCPDLRERIESKDLKRREIEAIVIYYNEHCGN